MNDEKKPGWWSRNWKWFVPVGCLGMIGIGVAFIAVIVSLVFGMMKSSDVYKGAMARANAHPGVVQAIGTPLKEGMFVSGNINVSGAAGDADLSIPVSGPKGAGTVYVVASKAGGKWTFTTLDFEVKGSGQRVNLLE